MFKIGVVETFGAKLLICQDEIESETNGPVPYDFQLNYLGIIRMCQAADEISYNPVNAEVPAIVADQTFYEGDNSARL